MYNTPYAFDVQGFLEVTTKNLITFYQIITFSIPKFQ
jgi:hypothetical protein